MRFFVDTIRKALADEQGGEAMEYVFIAGLIIVACLGLISAFGIKVVAKWTSVNSSM
jgi:Flp pilus assembly pilin Flp